MNLAVPTLLMPLLVAGHAPHITIKDLVVGKGKKAAAGAHVYIDYTGMLTNGTVFDDSKRHGPPLDFIVGGGRMIKGFDLGVRGMKVGGKRKLTLPPSFAYGDRAQEGIPANSTLIFIVQLRKIG